MAAHVPAWLQGFLGDASTLPPPALPLTDAVAGHQELRATSAGALAGALLVPDVKVADLIDALDHRETEDEVALAISVLVTGGAGAVGPAVQWATRAPVTRLSRIEGALRDEADLAHNARRFVTALDALDHDLTEIPVYLELPRFSGTPSAGWLSALDELAAAGVHATFRTGGAEPGPPAADLVAAFDAALDREVAFRCAGATTAALTGPDDRGDLCWGFVNLLVATRACLDGTDAAAVLAETDPARLLAGCDDGVLTRTRTWLDGVNVPDVLEAHEALVEAGLLGGESDISGR